MAADKTNFYPEYKIEQLEMWSKIYYIAQLLLGLLPNLFSAYGDPFMLHF